MDATSITKMIKEGMENHATKIAREKSVRAKWDLDVAVFLFAILIIVIILNMQGVGIEFIALASILGLSLGWLMGWYKGKKAFKEVFNEEMAKLDVDLEKMVQEEIDYRIRSHIRESRNNKGE